MNHFKVTFHSDDLVECGVKSDLWKLVEVTDRNGNAWSTTYRLTEKGSQIVTAIGLKESGRGHEILLKGPYRIEINGITDGSQPNTKNVAFRWDIDWDKAPPKISRPACRDLKCRATRWRSFNSITTLALHFVSEPRRHAAPAGRSARQSRASVRHWAIRVHSPKDLGGSRRLSDVEPMPTVVAIVRDAVYPGDHPDDVRSPKTSRLLAAGDAEEGWKLIVRGHADAILVESEVAHGTDLLERIADWDPGAQVLLLTDHYTAESAVEGIQHGARDCLSKPLSAEDSASSIGELFDEARVRRQTLELDERLLENCRFHGMVGRSPQMLETFARIRRVAPHYRIALISGATGTGKELVAQALHALEPGGDAAVRGL